MTMFLAWVMESSRAFTRGPAAKLSSNLGTHFVTRQMQGTQVGGESTRYFLMCKWIAKCRYLASSCDPYESEHVTGGQRRTVCAVVMGSSLRLEEDLSKITSSRQKCIVYSVCLGRHSSFSIQIIILPWSTAAVLDLLTSVPVRRSGGNVRCDHANRRLGAETQSKIGGVVYKT